MQSSQQPQASSSSSNTDVNASFTNFAISLQQGISERTSNTENAEDNSQQLQHNVNENDSRQNLSNWIRNEDMANSNNYWENMNKLLDAKFNNFELKFKDTILKEVKKSQNQLNVVSMI